MYAKFYQKVTDNEERKTSSKYDRTVSFSQQLEDKDISGKMDNHKLEHS
jgi:hypothetical protein